jgi:hypothetical protein
MTAPRPASSPLDEAAWQVARERHLPTDDELDVMTEDELKQLVARLAKLRERRRLGLDGTRTFDVFFAELRHSIRSRIQPERR